MPRDLQSGNPKWIHYAENIIQGTRIYEGFGEKVKGENQEYKRFWGNVILVCVVSGKNKTKYFSPQTTQYALCLCNYSNSKAVGLRTFVLVSKSTTFKMYEVQVLALFCLEILEVDGNTIFTDLCHLW